MIHLIVGNTGAGKTTYAHQLKKTNKGIVFSIDQWNNTLFWPDKTAESGLEWFLERIERVESMVMNLVLQLTEAHVDAILDLGLSKYEHREKFRVFAQEHNLAVKLHFLDIPSSVRRTRVLKRNTVQGATFEFEVTEENFEFMETWFEQPTPIELKDAVIIKV